MFHRHRTVSQKDPSTKQVKHGKYKHKEKRVMDIMRAELYTPEEFILPEMFYEKLSEQEKLTD